MSAPSACAEGGVGVGIARKVIFSLADGTGSLTGGGGGKLERRTGMCSDSGASPPRTNPPHTILGMENRDEEIRCDSRDIGNSNTCGLGIVSQALS